MNGKSKNYKEYEGTKIGRLTILKYLGHYKKKGGGKNEYHWFKCKCSCGNYVIKTEFYLFYSNVKKKSCGCWNTERTILFNKRTKTNFNNQYYIKDNKCYIEITNSKGKHRTIVDDIFLKYLIKKDRMLSIDSRGYAYITQEDANGRQMFIHNLVVFGEDYYNKNIDIVVDHINGDRLDNRIQNLRSTDNYGNAQNAKRRKDNTCGIKGFTIKNDDNTSAHIVVRIQANKKRIGKRFPLTQAGLEDAIKWNHCTRLQLHGEYSNFGYNIKGKTLDEIIKEQSDVFISNLTAKQRKMFYDK